MELDWDLDPDLHYKGTLAPGLLIFEPAPLASITNTKISKISVPVFLQTKLNINEPKTDASLLARLRSIS